MPNEVIDKAKRWLMVGCEIGQRGENIPRVDLSSLNSNENYPPIDVEIYMTPKPYV
jgi:hypothetical protein